MTTLNRQKFACSYYFAAPALAYGLFTSRLPAIRELASIDNAQTGSILLALGLSTLAGLLASNWLIERKGAKRVTVLAGALLCAGIILTCLAVSMVHLIICCIFTGLCVGLCDVGMNALGIELERTNNILCLSFLHGVSGIGGVTGSLAGALGAKTGLSPFINALIFLGIFLLLWPWAFRNLKNDKSVSERRERSRWKNIPVLLFVFGILSLLCHVAEGSVGEWGSILLHSVKGASQDKAALVFAVFTGAMVICRLCGDGLRKKVGDFCLVCGGTIIGLAGMLTVLLSPLANLCLLGYALMGFGLGPVVPVLFSKAGAQPGVSAGQASSIISVFSYSGLLLFPPLIGYVAQIAGLSHALWIIVACLALMLAGCGPLAAKRHD